MEKERERRSGESASSDYLWRRGLRHLSPAEEMVVGPPHSRSAHRPLSNPFLLSINSIPRLDGRTRAQRDFLSGNAAYHRGRRAAAAWEWVSNGRGWMTSPVRSSSMTHDRRKTSRGEKAMFRPALPPSAVCTAPCSLSRPRAQPSSERASE